MNLESLPRLIEFLRCLAVEEFAIDSKIYTPPATFSISDSFFRSYTCPPNCGGCCKPVTLLYFEHNIKQLLDKHSELKDDIHIRTVNINGKEKIFYELKNFNQSHCRFLCPHDKRCTIHDAHPLLCRFELKRFIHYKTGKVVLTKKLPGRGWLFGAQCSMIKFDNDAFCEDIQEMYELKEITNNFGIKNNIQFVINELIDKSKQYYDNNQTITD